MRINGNSAILQFVRVAVVEAPQYRNNNSDSAKHRLPEFLRSWAVQNLQSEQIDAVMHFGIPAAGTFASLLQRVTYGDDGCLVNLGAESVTTTPYNCVPATPSELTVDR